jgi:hypothetical protein
MWIEHEPLRNNPPNAYFITGTSMATIVRCIEGHAFDRAASEACPICRSTVWEKQPVAENKPRWDRTKAKETAVGTVSIVASIVLVLGTIYIAHNIWTSNLIKLVRQPPHPLRYEHASLLERLVEATIQDWHGEKPREPVNPLDNNTAFQPATGNETPKPFAPPQRGNPFGKKNVFQLVTGNENKNIVVQPTTGKEIPNPFAPE